MRLLLTAVLLLGAAQVMAAHSSTVLGSTNALLCYQASLLPLSTHGASDCSEAIRNDELGSRDLAATYANRGIIYAANGRLREAIADYDEALRLAPGMGRIYNNRANAYHHLRDLEKALADYERALATTDQVLDTIHFNKALTLILMRRWDEARASLEAALEANPDMARARNKLAEFDAPTLPSQPAETDVQDISGPAPEADSADP